MTTSDPATSRAVTLTLDEYERDNLLWLINATRATHNTGDWHGQIRRKLKPELGPGVPNVASSPLEALEQSRAECAALKAQIAQH